MKTIIMLSFALISCGPQITKDWIMVPASNHTVIQSIPDVPYKEGVINTRIEITTNLYYYRVFEYEDGKDY